MKLSQAVNELRENIWEIKRQHSLKRLRTFLKFILIGFLIGRNSDKRIAELKAKNRSIITNIREQFEELENIEQQVRDFAETYAFIKNIESRMQDFKGHLTDANDLLIEIEELSRERQAMLNCLKKSIEKKEKTISERVEKIVNSGTYLSYIDKEQCSSAIAEFEEDLSFCSANEVFDDEFIQTKRNRLNECLQTILNYNKEFVEKRKRDYSYLWYKGLLSLDDEQKTAIITDDKHNLVIAAAGSGKTEVLITRIAYLIMRKPDSVKPKRILAIAYQRKAREEIEKRLCDRYNIVDANVKTFHKLGKEILENAGIKIGRIDIVNDNKKREIVRQVFEHKVTNEPDFFNLFLQYVKDLHDKDEKNNFKTKEEMLTYAHKRAYHSLDNTRVNSRAEKEIMDFFLLNKLNGTPIEVKYEFNTGDFQPDFYLPQYDLFIEHWALDKDGKVPEWFGQSSEKYRETMEKKKRWLAEHDKLLVETFTYEYNEDSPERFIELLKTRIKEKLQKKYDDMFEFIPKTYNEIVEIVWKSCKTPIEDVVSFITTAKTYGITPEKANNRLHNMKWTSKQLAFGNLAVQVYAVYEEELRKNDKIDFEDMINNAIKELDDDPNLCADVYDHILIDEYQDISAQRYKLIKKLLERNPNCKLFCVGDDWQSVMGFSGSNVHFFVNFGNYFEKPAITKIYTNYRSVKSIVDAGADLIKNNTSCQIQKPTLSKRNEIKPITVLRSPHQKTFERNYYYQIAADCTSRIAYCLEKGCAPKDILVLTRYLRTRTAHGYKFPEVILAFLKEAREQGIRIVCDSAEAHNRIRLLTVHKSKGLEAKIVFILNVTKGVYGFPCEIEDSSIYEPVRENYPPQDKKQEERRLFYVAMTRAKEDLYIYTWEPAKSEFLDEIKEHTNEIRLSY